MELPAILFDPEARTLLFGMRRCTSCGYRTDDGVPAGRQVLFPDIPCGKCKGTGKRGNGRCRECKQYAEYGSKRPVGMVPDYAHPYAGDDCQRCKGTAQVPAEWTDSLPPQTLRTILDETPIRVYPREGGLSWGETHLGMLTASLDGLLPLPVFSLTDYGRAWERCTSGDVAGFVADVTEKLAGDHVQACKLSDRAGVVVDHIAILLAHTGYTVVGIPAPKHVDYPHEPNTLYDCAACELTCRHAAGEGDGWCVSHTHKSA